jgi:hypothetical protein
MTRELVLVHGRSQELKDPVALKAEWLDALRAGLAKNGLELPVPETSVHFPYYGDTLIQLIAGKTPEEAAKIIVKGDAGDAGYLDFVGAVLDEVQADRGVTDDDVIAAVGPDVVEKGVLNWPWVRSVLTVLDGRVPGTSGLVLALATNDVYEYLVARSIRDEIDEGVSAAFTPGVETVVVAHSLGTVVAYNVLRQIGAREGWVVPQLVTVGSPLGITRIRQEIVPPRWPSCVGAWFNAMDDRDVVALYPLTPEHFDVGAGHEIVNRTGVDNHTENRHGISGYLDDAATAKVIHDALTAG